MSKLAYKRLGSGFEVRMSKESPTPFGMIDRDIDGRFYWFPDIAVSGNHGAWPSWILRQLAEKLDRLNLPVDHEITGALEREP